MNQEARKLLNIIIPVCAFLVLIGIWQVGVVVSGIEKWILPAPGNVFQAMWEKKELIVSHSGQTIMETMIGLALAVVLGVGIAVLMEWSEFFQKLFKPFVIVSQTIPFIVLAPLLIIWLGFGILPKIVVVVLACFFPICMNVFDGFKSVDTTMVKLMRSMNATKAQIFRMVTLPASMPYFFSGLRVAGAYAVGVAVVSEWLGSERGLGVFLLRSAKSYQTEAVFAAIVIIALLSLLMVGIVEVIARKTIPWHFMNKGNSTV